MVLGMGGTDGKVGENDNEELDKRREVSGHRDYVLDMECRQSEVLWAPGEPVVCYLFCERMGIPLELTRRYEYL
jgi:hypothetical protein